MDPTSERKNSEIVADFSPSNAGKIVKNVLKRRSNVESLEQPLEQTSTIKKSKNLTNAPEVLVNLRQIEDEKIKNKITTVPSTQDQASGIYKLPMELLADILDYLPIEDLCEVRRTSKWFHQVAGFAFQQNYSAYWRSNSHQRGKNLNVFHQVIQKVRIIGDEQKYPQEYKYFFYRRSNFHQLKIMELQCIDLTNIRMEFMKEILHKIEDLRLDSCKISKRFIESIPVLFPNLKRLSMQEQLRESVWIACKCPKLEDFRFTSYSKTEAITTFLQMNPNVRKLAINSNCLWNNRVLIKAAKLTLDELAIKIYFNIFTKEIPLTLIFELLIELHELGIYQRLKLYSFYSHIEKEFDELNLLPALIKLHFYGHGLEQMYTKRFTLSSFENLEEISVLTSYNLDDIEAIADNLENLERIRFEKAVFDDIVTFIKRARKLTKIRVTKFVRFPSDVQRVDKVVSYPKNKFISDTDFEEQAIINLSLLNSERAKVLNAKMVTLYVNENVYLATKWAMDRTHFDSVQLRRLKSFEWDHDFPPEYLWCHSHQLFGWHINFP